MKFPPFIAYRRAAATLFFGTVIFCFWYFFFPYAVVAQERLFVWDVEFWEEYDALQYARDFVLQFFYEAFLGSLLLASLCAAMQVLAWMILSHLWKNRLAFWLSFLPSVLLWYSLYQSFPVHDAELEYDWLQRRGKWEMIIEKGQREMPPTLACQNVFRLAQWQVGMISETDFLGSLPLTNEALTGRVAAYMMSDVYMSVGMVNMAQRASFEAMASIEDFSMSGRSLRRLTETALITEQYEVVRKYASLLSHTVYYRDFALQMEEMVVHPELGQEHPFYGRLQKIYKNTNDVLFN